MNYIAGADPMAKPTASEIKNNVQAEDAAIWQEANERPEGLDLFEADLAQAIAAAWSDVEDAFAIASVPVTGGSSAPGGPLSNGTAALASGSLTNALTFSLIADYFSTSFPDGPSEGLLSLVDAIAQGIGTNFSLWVPGFSATLTASGGTCAWVAGPTPAPGPWTAGTLEAFALTGGISSGDAGMSSQGLDTAISAAVDPTIFKPPGQSELQPGVKALITATSKGFSKTWDQWKQETSISGGVGTGTASPPNGSVLGQVASPTVS